ncbi:MAG: 30S ribosomal protein S4 [Methanomicrobiales archaeon]|nr:30S ribosomal protein S4 [Methanomicrobiales archaeon]
MGYPGKNHKRYERPTRKWEKSRLQEEAGIIVEYGLRNKRELWRTQNMLRNHRRGARAILAMTSGGASVEQVMLRKKQLLEHLERMGMLGRDADIGQILALKVQQQLERRLQTIVYRKGLARSPKQARQFITHGHIAINGRKVTIPGYLVSRAEEAGVQYAPHSPIQNEVHPERARIAKVGR